MKKLVNFLLGLIVAFGLCCCLGNGCATGASAFVDGFNRGYNQNYEPVQVEKGDCPYCHGTGLKECTSCQGTGYTRGYKCYQCTGGLVKCFYCRGTGKN